MATSTIYSIPGYLGQLKVAKAISGSAPAFPYTALPFWSHEYGGACNPRGIYLASGIPFLDVFPERQTLTAWAFSGPARNDFNPFNLSSSCMLGLTQTMAPGKLVTAEFILYGGSANLGPQVGGTKAAFVADFHWSGQSRSQAMWRCILVAAWDYYHLGSSYSDAQGARFRIPGDDSSYNIPSS